MSHRVVVTGVGCVSPIGLNARTSFQNLLSGLSVIRNLLDLPDWSHLHSNIRHLSSQLAAPVLQLTPRNSSLADRIKTPRSFSFAQMAATEALNDSNMKSLENVGIFFGTGMAGVSETFETANLISDNKRISPYFVPAVLSNSPAGHLSRVFGLKGPISSPSLACATGSYAIGEAFRYLRDPNELGCDAILAGATEAPLNAPTIAGFSRLRALSSSNSCPFDINRDGFVLGEGAGCLVLERLDSAIKRDARIYAEIIGFGSSSDAYHPTSPDPSNSGAIKAINSALRTRLHHKLVAVNAHATSTKLGDEIELSALEKCLKSCHDISVVSNKGAIGHLLGASGAVESIFTVLSMANSILPANLNLQNKLPTPFNLPTRNIQLPKDANDVSILKTSFGFGSENAFRGLATDMPRRPSSDVIDLTDEPSLNSVPNSPTTTKTSASSSSSSVEVISVDDSSNSQTFKTATRPIEVTEMSLTITSSPLQARVSKTKNHRLANPTLSEEILVVKTTGRTPNLRSLKPQKPIVISSDSKSNPPQASVPDKKCPICFDALKNPSVTLCGHVYCTPCIKAAVQAAKQCPICRKKITMKGFHPLYL